LFVYRVKYTDLQFARDEEFPVSTEHYDKPIQDSSQYRMTGIQMGGESTKLIKTFTNSTTTAALNQSNFHAHENDSYD
jgi:hypothetical protein